MSYVIDFKDVDRSFLSTVGGKNASLGELLKAGINVPPGFAVSTESYLSFITESGIKDDIYSRLSDLDPSRVADLNDASAEVQEMICKHPMSSEIRDAIVESYTGLCRQCHTDPLPVAVRSSATAEDLPSASFAGQQETFLWIQGEGGVLESVRKCWASLFTPRAIAYRIKNNFDHDKVLISVGVQKMVSAKAAGVMFTLNPVNGDLSKVVIEGAWGLGETVVSGSVNPDKFVVDKVIMETSEKKISAKHIQCIFDPNCGSVVDADVREDMQCACCLTDEEIHALVVTAKRIEKHYGCAMDIEWSIDGDVSFPENVFIVQARPETVWSQRAKKNVLGEKSGRQLLMEQAMKVIKLNG